MTDPAYNLPPEHYSATNSESVESVSPSSLTRFLCLAPIWMNLFVLTIAMGGVIPWISSLCQTITFACLAIVLTQAEGQIAFKRILATPWLIALLLAPTFLIIYGSISTVIQQIPQLSHPVLGTVSSFAHPMAAWDTIQSIAFFEGTLLLAAVAISLYGSQIITRWMNMLTWGVCLIALSHWFYDNGKLFWIFEPNNMVGQTRARWPFVNPNHLGHCCLLMLAYALIIVKNNYRSFEDSVLKDRDNRVGAIIKRFSQKSVQQRYWRLMVSSLLVATTLLTIFGSLSRGSWLGLVLVSAILGITLVVRIIPLTIRQKRARRSYTIAQRYKLTIRKVLVAMLVVGLFAALLLFLQGRGSDLVQERVIYGLTKSKDDLRWQLYTETKPILSAHALTGVGLGQWPDAFRQIELPELSGYIPEFLHSDPYQLLVEIGVPAFVVFSALLIVAMGLRIYHQADMNLCIVVCCILGFIAASLLDFPFRIPSLTCLLAIMLAGLFEKTNERA